MSILLQSVELSNIRSHGYIFFKPAEQGVTTLSGPNGSGKSTVIDSIAWALFGTKLGGVKNAAVMKDHVEYQKGKFFVRVLLTVNNHDILIERKFASKAGTVEANVYSVESPDENDEDDFTSIAAEDSGDKETMTTVVQNEDGVEYTDLYYLNRKLIHLAGPAVSHSEGYVKNLLRMDEKGFLSSILVQQKQVDQLISASAKERATVIEDLTGITAVTDALKTARAEYNSIKKAASLSHADEDGIKEGEENLRVLHRESNLNEQEYGKLKDDLKIIKEEGKEVSAQFKEAQESYDKKISLQSDLESSKRMLAEKKTTADDLVEERNELKSSLGSMTSVESAKKVIQERDETRESLNTEKANLQVTKKEYQSADSKEKETENRVSSIAETLSDNETLEASDIISENIDVEEKIKGTESLIEELEKEQQQKNDEQASLRSENKTIHDAIHVLSAEDGSCPTCLQTVDSPDVAVKKLQDSVQSNDETLESLSEILSGISSNISRSNEELSLWKELKGCYQDKKNSTETKGKLSDKIEHSNGVIRDHSEALKSLESKAESASKAIYQLEEYQRVLKKAQEASKQLNLLNMEIEDLKEKIADLPNISKEKLDRISKKLEDKRTKYQEQDKKKITAKHQFSMAQEKITAESNRVSKMREDLERHREIMESVSIHSASMKIIEEFRRELIDSSVPVIESYASDFLARFTDSKFVQFTMDNRFNASVMLSDGTVRPVSALSGGELSAAAVALRLAISMLLNGQSSGSVILLDEILVSMDDERSSRIMHTIKEALNGQIVFIAHSDAVNAVADSTFLLTENREAADVIADSESDDDEYAGLVFDSSDEPEEINAYQ